jgi:hypothetical protein
MGEQFMRRKKEGVIFSEKLDGFFRERYAPLIAEGRAVEKIEAKAEAILIVLRERFKKVPKATEIAIRQLRDPVALDSWTAYAASCQSMDEFVAALK